MIYSANMLKIYKSCPYKYKLKYVEKFSLPQRFEIFEKGKKIHALAYYYLKGDDITRFETALNTDEKNVWASLKSNEYFNKQTYRVEFELSCKFDEFWIGGRLDAVVKDKENNYFILDYKTGKIPDNPETDPQTLVYLKLLDARLAGNYNSLNFVYIDLKNNRNYLIESHSVDMELIKNICVGVNKEIFDFNFGTACLSCEYNHFCS